MNFFKDLSDDEKVGWCCCISICICLGLFIILIYTARHKGNNDTLEYDSSVQCISDNDKYHAFDFNDCSDKEIQKMSIASQIFLGISGGLLVIYCACGCPGIDKDD